MLLNIHQYLKVVPVHFSTNFLQLNINKVTNIVSFLDLEKENLRISNNGDFFKSEKKDILTLLNQYAEGKMITNFCLRVTL